MVHYRMKHTASVCERRFFAILWSEKRADTHPDSLLSDESEGVQRVVIPSEHMAGSFPLCTCLGCQISSD